MARAQVKSPLPPIPIVNCIVSIIDCPAVRSIYWICLLIWLHFGPLPSRHRLCSITVATAAPTTVANKKRPSLGFVSRSIKSNKQSSNSRPHKFNNWDGEGLLFTRRFLRNDEDADEIVRVNLVRLLPLHHHGCKFHSFLSAPQ